jgi:uncharacterized protein (DUF362 family)
MFLSLAAGGATLATRGVTLAGQPQPYQDRSTVALIDGEDRRTNVHDALVAIDDQIRPGLRRKEYVLIKPNCVAVNNQVGSTHADALRGILDYLEPRFKGPIVIADSSKDDTRDAYENFGYDRVIAEHRSQNPRLVDLNDETGFVPHEVIDRNMHLTPVRLAARLFDPDAFILGCALPKAHDWVVVTMSVKNLVMAAPLHSSRKEATEWHDKYKYHAGARAIQMNVALTAKRMRRFWGATVVDGFEGMEGEGPLRGTAVKSRFALASTDCVAADRVGVEAMGVDATWPGYLQYCCNMGLGQYDLSKIDLRGGIAIERVRKQYKLHPRLDRQLEWMGDLPRKG